MEMNGTDDVVAQYRQVPLVSYEKRREMISQLAFVKEVVKQDTLSYEEIIKKYHPDIIVHGDEWKSGSKSRIRKELLELLQKYGGELVEFPYTEDETRTFGTSAKIWRGVGRVSIY